MVYVKGNRTALSLGVYQSEELAAVAYNLGALRYYGEFASLNTIAERQAA